ncbi:MAG: hypothetical protein COB36_11920 [Alphaproteobacteria bacterium]|nr:MAG: hypothetical protein COB36_11920 [Alphaproteobacteria bacterium]
MSDVNSNISGTQSGGFTTKDKVLNQTIGMQSSIKSGGTQKKSGGPSGLSDFYNPIAEKVQRTGNSITDFFRGFTSGLGFENGVSEAAYDF